MGALLLLAACGDGPASPNARAITLVEGGGVAARALQARPLVVAVADARGRPAAGVAVVFAVLAGNGTLSTSGAVTDASGTARTAWALGAGLDTQVVRVSAPEAREIDVKGVVGVARTAVAPAAPRTWVGAALHLRAVLADAAGQPLADVGGASWSVADPSVAAVTPAGVLTGLAPGTTTVTMSGSSGTLAVPLTVAAAADAPRTLAGRVVTGDGASLAGFRAHFRTAEAMWSVPVDGAGAYALPTDAAGQMVELFVDEPGAAASARRYHPAWLSRLVFALPPQPRVDPVATIVLVPRQWKIEGGTFAGATVAVSANAAFAPPCPALLDDNCEGFYPSSWFSGIKLWPDSMLPVRVALHHALSNETIRDADSTALWATLRKMGDDMGRPVFRPARYQDLTPLDPGWADYAIVVRVDTTIRNFIAFTGWRWDGFNDLTAGTVRVNRRATLSSGSLMAHELLHALGFKHSCGWDSVMGGYGCTGAASLSAADVAHWQLARHLRDLQRAHATNLGLVEAMQGERVLMLGRKPFVPGEPFAVRRAPAPGRAYYEDGVP